MLLEMLELELLEVARKWQEVATPILGTGTLKVYTEGFRVLLLNGTVIGCKSINLYPIV